MPDDEKPQDTAQNNGGSQPPFGQGSFEKRLRLAAIKRAEVLAAKNAEVSKSTGDLASPPAKSSIRKYYIKPRHRSLRVKNTKPNKPTSGQADVSVIAPQPLLLEQPVFEPLPSQSPEETNLAQVFRTNVWGRGRFGKICSACSGLLPFGTWTMIGVLFKVALIFMAGVVAGILLL